MAAAAAATAVLAHPWIDRARRSAEVRRETAVTLVQDDGTLIEGVIDLAFREPRGDAFVWTVVDFKTDVELEGRLDEYRRQVALYARAIADATGRPARAVLLRV